MEREKKYFINFFMKYPLVEIITMKIPLSHILDVRIKSVCKRILWFCWNLKDIYVHIKESYDY